MKQITLTKIEYLDYPVYIGSDLWNEIDILIQPFLKSGGIYILTDQNTKKDCLPVVKNYLPKLAQQSLFSILPGDQSKELAGLEAIWNWLMNAGAVKDSLIINLGGGVVSDLGGFAAATYKRGIRYINIPTSLIGQADAAVGGKTAINISGVKNQAGLFFNPMAVFIVPEFLKTLPEIHYKSGFAEIIKCAALSGNGFWELLKNEKPPEPDYIFKLIFETVNFKCKIVSEDPFDQSIRKMLNFGHTVGHALESFSYRPNRAEMLHGTSVAAGMICEAYLSYLSEGLPKNELEEITTVIKKYFDLKPFENRSYNEFLMLMDHDKKKTTHGVGFSLLERLGKPSLERSVDRVNIIRSFEYFNQVNKSDQDY